MNEEEYQRILRRLVRVGLVSSVDNTTSMVRVYFDDVDMVSDWLPVLQHPGAGVAVDSVDGHTHGATASEGTVTIGSSGGHYHHAALGKWMPAVNDRVLCIYLPMFNADGFVLGAIT